jgi:hypothetical protein
MSSIAASQPKDATIARPLSLGSIVHSSAFATALLGAIVTAFGWFVGPMVARTLQNHEKSLEVRSALATDMSKSFTMAVGAGQRVASGLIYGPTGDRHKNAAVVQGAYNTGLGQWQVDAGRIGAQLAARYPRNAIVGEWRRYRLAVTRFYRLSAALPAGERASFVRRTQAYFRRVKTIPWTAKAVSQKVKWAPLFQTKGFRKSARYRQAYDKVSSLFVSIGDAFVDEVLSLRPEV